MTKAAKLPSDTPLQLFQLVPAAASVAAVASVASADSVAAVYPASAAAA